MVPGAQHLGSRARPQIWPGRGSAAGRVCSRARTSPHESASPRPAACRDPVFSSPFKSRGSQRNWKPAGCTRGCEDNADTTARPKKHESFGGLFPVFKRDLVELGSRGSYYNLAGPGGFPGNVFTRPTSAGVVKSLGCFMK